MGELILIDTDILIDVGRKVQEAVEQLDQEELTSAPRISVVTQMELIVGCRNKKELIIEGLKLVPYPSRPKSSTRT